MIVVVALWMLSAQLPSPPAPLDPVDPLEPAKPASGDVIVDDDEEAAATDAPPGDPPPAPGAEPTDPAGAPSPDAPPKPKPEASPSTSRRLPAPEREPPPTPAASEWLMPSAAAGAFLGTSAAVALGVVLVATGGTVALAASPDNKLVVELLGLGVLLAAPALGGLFSGAAALFFLDGATANDWLTMALCTSLAWVGTLGIVALAAVGLIGGGAGCNPGSCGSGCGSCGSGSSSATNDDDVFGTPAHGAAAGAVFGAFLGGAAAAGITYVGAGDDVENVPLWSAVAFAVGAAAGAPLGAVVGVSLME